MLVPVLAAALVVVAPHMTGNAPETDPLIERTEAGHAELSAGRPEAAIARIASAGAASTANPAAVLNLAAAHARLGRIDDARRLLAAVDGGMDRFDLQLADGRWMDSRHAARIALRSLDSRRALAVR